MPKLLLLLAAVMAHAHGRPSDRRPCLLVPPPHEVSETTRASAPKTAISEVLQGAPLPAVIDYRLAGPPRVVTSVKDQQACGSCWAFSAAESLEGQLGLNGHETNVSAQNLVDCVALDFGCGGGWMADALAYAEAHGIETASDYPYTGVGAPCAANASDATIRATAYVNVAKTNHGLKTALATFGPISIALDATDTFMAYNASAAKVLTDATCDSTTPNHALLLAGYNDVAGYWIIKNSWGTDWGGMGGYVYANNTIENMCGIASFATAAYIAPTSYDEEHARVCAHMEAFPISYRGRYKPHCP